MAFLSLLIVLLVSLIVKSHSWSRNTLLQELTASISPTVNKIVLTEIYEYIKIVLTEI